MGQRRGGSNNQTGSAVGQQKGSKLDRTCPVCNARPNQRCFKTGSNNYGETMSHQHPQR